MNSALASESTSPSGCMHESQFDRSPDSLRGKVAARRQCSYLQFLRKGGYVLYPVGYRKNQLGFCNRPPAPQEGHHSVKKYSTVQAGRIQGPG
jgi:hypothetical protein